MPSTSDALARSLVLALLAALALCVAGHPVAREDHSAEAAGDTLGSSPLWATIIEVTRHHETQFEDEFVQKYRSLDDYRIPAPMGGCPKDLNKEACFQRLAEGLHTFTALLPLAQTELPDSSIPREGRRLAERLVTRVKQEMKHPGRVAEVTAGQREELRAALSDPDDLRRKMKAHNVLRQLHLFLLDGKRAVVHKERL